jgi:hypothetical protein
MVSLGRGLLIGSDTAAFRVNGQRIHFFSAGFLLSRRMLRRRPAFATCLCAMNCRRSSNGYAFCKRAHIWALSADASLSAFTAWLTCRRVWTMQSASHTRLVCSGLLFRGDDDVVEVAGRSRVRCHSDRRLRCRRVCAPEVTFRSRVAEDCDSNQSVCVLPPHRRLLH